MLRLPLLALLLCQGERGQAQGIREWKADVNPAHWWQDSVWNSEWPKYRDGAWFYPDEDNPTRSAFLTLPDPELHSWEEIEEILDDNFYYRVFGGVNPLTYVLGDIDVASRGDQGPYKDHFMMNAGFINALGHNSGGWPYIERFGQRDYGLETGNVRVGLNIERRGIARNDGFWRIGGHLSIGQYSEFINHGTAVVTGVTTLQNGAELNVRSGLFDAGRLSIFGSSNTRLTIGVRGESQSSARLLSRQSLVAPCTLYMSGGARLEVEGTLGVSSFDTDQARDPVSIYGNIIQAEGTSVGGEGTMKLGKRDRLSTNSLDIDAGSEFRVTESVVNIPGTASVNGGAQFWATNSSLNVGTLSAGGSAYLRGKPYQNGSTPDIVLGQLGVSGYAGLYGWVRAGGLSASSGTIGIYEDSRLELTGSAAVAGNGRLSVNGSNALLTGTGMSLSGSATGEPASLEVEDHAQVFFNNTLSTSSATGGGSSRITVSGLGRLEAKRMEFGMTGGTKTELVIADGGTVTATEGMNLNYGHFTDNASTIIYGGPDGEGGYRNPGLLVTPYVTKPSENGVMTMRFQHRDTGTLFWPKLENLGIVESTGPGRTVLRGQVTNVGVIRADMGTLEINHGEAPNTLTLGTLVRGGNLVVKGCELLVNPAGFSGSSVTDGTLSVTEGGFLRSALTISRTGGNPAEVIVDGAGSSILAQRNFAIIGNTGAGLLTIRNLGKVSCDAGTVMRLGSQPGFQGTVRVSSLGELRANELAVGHQGAGLLDLPTAGIAKISGGTVIGGSAAGLAQVGPLSDLQADGGLTVGYNAKGELKIRGGTVRVGPTGQGTLVLGETSYGDGSVWFEENGGTLFASGITSGEEGVGRIVFNHTAPNLMFRTSISGAAMSVSSRKGTTTFDLPFADVSMLEVPGGTLHIANGTRFSAFGDITVGLNDYFSEIGTLVVSGEGTVCENYARPIELRMRGGLHVNDGARVICGEGGGPITLGRADEPGSPGFPGGALFIGGAVPGIIEASAVKALGPPDEDPGYWSAVFFRHGSPRYEFGVPMQGNLVFNHEGPGTTVIPVPLQHTGGTNVTGGRLVLNAAGGDATVTGTGKLGGTGRLRDVIVKDGGTLAPGDPTSGGNPVGRLRSTRLASFQSGGKFEVGIGDWSGNIAGTHWDQLQVSQLTIAATAANPFVIKVTGPAANFTETAKTINIVTTTGTGIIPNPLNVVVDATDFPGTGTWAVSRLTSALRLVYTPGTETPYEQWARLAGLTEGNSAPEDDADQDGLNNLAEFALDGNPLGGAGDGKRASAVETSSGTKQVLLTLPVRQGAVFGGNPLVSNAVDGVIYRIEASADLSAWTLPVVEVTGPDAEAQQVGMPPLSNANWTYRTFSTAVLPPGFPKLFIRARISPP